MILGIGIDLVDIRRITRLIDRFGDRFLGHTFTPQERALCDGRRERAAAYAKRFAAKEACVKALGTGFSGGIWFPQIEVLRDAKTGQPALHLSGFAKEALLARVLKGQRPALHLSLTDDFPYAQAMVVLSVEGTPEA